VSVEMVLCYFNSVQIFVVPLWHRYNTSVKFCCFILDYNTRCVTKNTLRRIISLVSLKFLAYLSRCLLTNRDLITTAESTNRKTQNF
jgi:hypothetical protein